MRLVSLAANKQTFHTVKFNRKGISLIVGKQKDAEPSKQSATQTYNGVGKSLLLYLVNYCLGADAKEPFCQQLADWEFTLTIELNGVDVPVTRRVADPTKVRFGSDEISIDAYRERLQRAAFPAAVGVKFLTFRSLIGLFLRPGETAYNRYDSIHYSERPVQKLIRSAYLLGLDVELVIRKYDLVEELKQMREMSNRFSKDPIIKEYFQGKKDVNLDIRDLEDQLAQLEQSLTDFKVAENYHEVELQAADIKNQLQKTRNSAVILDSKLHQVDESLTIKPGVTLEMVANLYAEAKVHFTPELIRSLDEVQRFHSDLLTERRKRLKGEKLGFEGQLAKLKAKIDSLSSELDTQLRFLNEHGALGELLSLKDRANETRNSLQKLLDFKALTKQFKDRNAQLQVDLATSNLRAQTYLNEQQEIIESAAAVFRSITRRLYPDKQSGLTVENDSRESQTCFSIDAKVVDDASHGINKAKIFAYDITLITLRRNHDIRFLCHDSRLFSDIDHRQRGEIFKIATESSNNLDFQYIATINQDQLDAIRPVLAESFDPIVTESTVLELKDDAPEDKLLGIEIDLDYD
jgi:uncharacterized protein YydD (DUF2326 family)